MERHIFSFSEAEARVLADRFFLEAGHFDLTQQRHLRMAETGRALLEELKNAITIRGCYGVCGPETCGDGKIHIGEECLQATAFARIETAAVRLVIPYLITGGDGYFSDHDDIMKQLYGYMWGTAYVDAGRFLLEAMLKKVFAIDEKQWVLSPPFGPGFYGMDNRQSGAILRILSGQDLGFRVTESGVMQPIKSCSGLYLITDGTADLPDTECMDCNANRQGCFHCMIRNRKRGLHAGETGGE
jgi:hypothetical protein